VDWTHIRTSVSRLEQSLSARLQSAQEVIAVRPQDGTLLAWRGRLRRGRVTLEPLALSEVRDAALVLLQPGQYAIKTLAYDEEEAPDWEFWLEENRRLLFPGGLGPSAFFVDYHWSGKKKQVRVTYVSRSLASAIREKTNANVALLFALGQSPEQSPAEQIHAALSGRATLLRSEMRAFNAIAEGSRRWLLLLLLFGLIAAGAGHLSDSIAAYLIHEQEEKLLAFGSEQREWNELRQSLVNLQNKQLDLQRFAGQHSAFAGRLDSIWRLLPPASWLGEVRFDQKQLTMDIYSADLQTLGAYSEHLRQMSFVRSVATTAVSALAKGEIRRIWPRAGPAYRLSLRLAWSENG
jgi:Tfp pilus assembly protein PilN